MALEEYYNNYDEAGRLKRDNIHAIEYRTTLHYLLKYLPEKCTVLDCCAGCGAYAFPLAENGYKVTAGDLIKKHVDFINSSEQRNLLNDVYQGDTLDMSRFRNESFDAVLCLGALYHLQIESEREKCVEECSRVLKPKGIFIFSYINRNAVFINHFLQNPANINDEMDLMESGKNGIFYGMAFGEADNLGIKFNIKKLTNVSVDGLIYPLREAINSLDSEKFESYIRYHFRVCEEPSIIGHSMHGLWIGRK